MRVRVLSRQKARGHLYIIIKNTIVFFSNMTYIIHYNKTCALFFFNISKQFKLNATYNIYKRLNLKLKCHIFKVFNNKR